MRCLCPLGVWGERADDRVATQHSRRLSKQMKADHEKEERVIKLLLLGTAESGKSTMTKQMKIIHINGYNNEERRQRIPDIRKNLRDAIMSILGAMDRLHITFHNEKCAASADYLTQYSTLPDYHYPQEFYLHLATLWADDGVQACFRCSSQYQLIDSAKYLLDRLHVIQEEDYIPSDQDILRCRTMTNTIQKIDFSVPDGRTLVPFRVYDVGGQRGERQKWIQVFDMCTAILFLVDAGNFDLMLREDPSTSRFLEAALTFEKVWSNRWLRYVSIILFINKIDILEEKITSGTSFADFVNSVDQKHPYYELLQHYHKLGKIKESERREFLDAFPHHHHRQLVQSNSKQSNDRLSPHSHLETEVVRTAVFIKRFFLQLVQTPVTQERPSKWHDSHTCEYYYTCAVDTDNTRKVLEGCRTLIIKKHLERWGLSLY